MTPWLDDGDLKLYHGDCLDVLRGLPDRSVHMCATSPPFYGLRDYGTGRWEGGDPGHEHDRVGARGGRGGSGAPGKNTVGATPATVPVPVCSCGARYVDPQIGLEESPDQWVGRLVEVFREVRRVLRDDGTLWVEIGDSYTSAASGGAGAPAKQHTNAGSLIGRGTTPPGHKPKDLLGQPWMLAFALRADGWYLRSEIIWARPNPMPESVTDRPTKAHSTIFLLSKQPRYFFDADAIREPYSEPQGGRAHRRYPEGFKEDASGNGRSGRMQGPTPGQIAPPQAETLDDSLPPEAPRGPDGRRQTGVKGGENSEQHRDGERWPDPAGANARSVWTIPTEPTPFAHFATWPQKLVARMVKAGTSEHGCCPECGAPWERVTEPYERKTGDWNAHLDGQAGRLKHGQSTAPSAPSDWVPPRTLGWQPSCSHDHPPVPCTVLDIFAGSGTTLKVARDHGRHSVGIELNEQYLRIAADRLAQQSLLTGEAA